MKFTKKQPAKKVKDNQESSNINMEILKLKRHIERSKWVTGAIALITAIFSVFATASVININIGVEEEPSTINEALVKAQDYYYSEKYYDALALYQEFASESEIASINLGYMYSRGLGCTRDFDLACDYYKKAYLMGAEEGLANYLAINFLTPNDLNSSIVALEYGVKEGFSPAIRYAAFLQTGESFATCDTSVVKYANQFFENSNDKQKEMLNKQKIEKSQEIELYEQNTAPKNTEFVEYLYNGEITQRYVVRYINAYEEVEKNVLLKTEYPVYDFATYYSYIVKGLEFKYSDFTFSENYYKI